MDLFERVSEDIKNAMKAKDKGALETLRNVKKFFPRSEDRSGSQRYIDRCRCIEDHAKARQTG